MDEGFVGNNHLVVEGPGGGKAQQDKDDHTHAGVQHLVVVWHGETQIGSKLPGNMGRSPGGQRRGT